jgi:RNA recognition motif-containing protein
MVRTKVFVGNLSFKTREPDLAAAFSAAGKVASANIITRGPRSLGYGFVELESEEEAQKAVALMNKKTIDDREINVEVAKPREDQALEDRPPPRARRPRARAFRRDSDPQADGAQAPKADAASPQNNGQRVRKPRRPAQPGQVQNNAAQQPQVPPQGQDQGERRPRRPRTKPENKQQEQPRHLGSPSKTTLFVANLPFAVDDAQLSQIFANLSVKSAHVVRKRNGRSKGFGFVEFETEDAQQQAKNAIDKKTVDDRELIVKVALTENKEGAAVDSKDEKKPEAKAQ